MEDIHIREKQLAFIITTRCTLQCKHCADMIPIFKRLGMARHTPLEQVRQEVDAVFQIYDYIEDVTVTGGEPFLHPELAEILSHCLMWESRFDFLRIFSNGTMVPGEQIMELFHQHPKLSLVIDDYGPDKSKKMGEISALFVRHGLPLRVNTYWGENPYCGGWVDYGNPKFFHNYSPETVNAMYQNCHVAQYKCLNEYNGKLLNCSWGLLGVELDIFPKVNAYPQKDQLIRLLDADMTLAERKRIAMAFGSTPHRGCQFCKGFDSQRSIRIPAAEQL